jgi:hypothetical protein
MTKFPKIGLDNASQYLNDVLLPSYDRFKRMQTRQMPRRSGSPWMWTLAFGHHEDRNANTRLRADARGRDGGVREKRAARVNNDNARHRSLGGVFSLTRPSKVRFRGQTGEHLLSPSFTDFDPERSSRAFIGLAYRP